MSATVVARSAAWKIDAFSFSTVKSLLALFPVYMKFCCVSTKLSSIDSFLLFRREIHQWDSVIYHFFTSTTQNMSLWLCLKQSSITRRCWRERVIYWKKLSTTSGLMCLQPKICNYCNSWSLVCSCPPSRQKCYHKRIWQFLNIS